MKCSTVFGWVICAAMVCGLGGTARAQSFSYTFSSGPFGDGFNWPASPTGQLDGDSFITPQGIEFFNSTGNSVFYDNNYQTIGNGIQITGDALWGNPLDIGSGGYVGIDLSTFSPGLVTEVSFDFAWTEAGVPAAYDFLSIYFEDSDGRANFNSYQLSQTFTGLGGSTGFEDFLSFDTAFLTDDFNNIDGGNFVDIAYMEVYVDEISFGGNNSEYAIDNFAVNNGGGGLDPENSDIHPGGLNGGLGGIGTNSLRTATTSFFNFGFFEVSNEGTGATTYSVSLDPTSDPEFVEDSPPANALINGGEQINEGSGNIAIIDTSNPSGDYFASATIHNDLNPFDPDEVVTYHIRILDPPSLTDDAGSTVQAHLDPDIFIANAAAGPHAGAVRASVKVTNHVVTGDGFQVNGLNVDDAVDPAEAEHATVTFDRYGRLNGTFTGTFSVGLVMTDTQFSFLNGAQPVPSANWNLSYTLSTVSSDSVAVNAADPLGPGVIGVNDAQVAATLLDGQSAANQNVSMAFSLNPDPAGADLTGDPIDLTFSSGNVGLYVLQFTYLDGNVPVGITESQLQVLFYDPIAGAWDVAVDGNTGGGTTFFNGSYDDYLAAVGGGVLDAGDLGAFGVDTVNNHAWAVLNHASIFGVGVLTAGTLPGDLDGDGFVGIADLNLVLGNWNQNVTPGDPLSGDPSGDGFVGIEDLNTVLGNWNAGTPPTDTANIPEPGVVGVMVVGVGGYALNRKRCRG